MHALIKIISLLLEKKGMGKPGQQHNQQLGHP
jgi:hypothetical protein